MDRQFTLDDFRPHLNDTFRLDVEPEPLDLALTEAELSSPKAAMPGGREPFALLFTGPAEPLLRQRLYRLAHPEMGEFELFLVPVGSDADGTRYEAVFN